jgi:SAM-dependent methyltransferase
MILPKSIPKPPTQTPDCEVHEDGERSLSPDVIRLAYRLVLGREPESEDIVARTLGYGTIESLREALLASDEFRLRMGRCPPVGAVPLDVPPIEVQVAVDGAAAAALLAHVQETWTRLGNEQPHWSVLSADQFKPEHIAKNEDAFYGSGAADTATLIAALHRHGFAPEQLPRILEYGCGLGRVTAHLAHAFNSVVACDISPSHIQKAKETVCMTGAANVAFRLVGLPEFGMHDNFDLWYSRLVLQHNPPPIIAMILRRAFVQLVPGGVAVFQVPTYAVGYRFTLDEYLSGVNRSDSIEMHVLPQRAVLDIVRDAGCIPFEIREDASVGHSGTWLSNMFVIGKPSLGAGSITRPLSP